MLKYYFDFYFYIFIFNLGIIFYIASGLWLILPKSFFANFCILLVKPLGISVDSLLSACSNSSNNSKLFHGSISPHVKKSAAAYPYSGQVCIVKWDSAIITAPDTPHGKVLSY